MAAKSQQISKHEAELAYKIRKADGWFGLGRMLGYIIISALAAWATVSVAESMAGQETAVNLNMQIAWGAAGVLGVTLTAQIGICRTRKKKIQRQRELIDSLETQLLEAQGKGRKREEKR